MPVIMPLQPTLYEEATEAIPAMPLADTPINATRLPAPSQPQISPIRSNLDICLKHDRIEQEFKIDMRSLWLTILIVPAVFTAVWLYLFH